MVPLHVLQLSDVHLTATGDHVNGRDRDRRLRAVLDAVRRDETRVDLVVITGDLTDDGSVVGCQRLAEAIVSFSVPS